MHIVRDPRSWVPSIMRHETTGIRKYQIKFTPHTSPKIKQLSSQWGRMTKVMKMIARWVEYNERVGSLKMVSDNYRVMRYEDIFSSDTKTSLENKNSLLEFF